jgi:hypothetical protein
MLFPTATAVAGTSGVRALTDPAVISIESQTLWIADETWLASVELSSLNTDETVASKIVTAMEMTPIRRVIGSIRAP